MKARLTFKKADPWSGMTIYKNCRHGIGPYLKRSGVRYTGLDDDNLRKRLEGILKVDLLPQSKFWDDFNIFLGENDIILDTTVPEEELKYYFLKSHKRVALGLKDIKPSTDYVLLQEEEEAKEENSKARMRRKAMLEFDKLTPNEMRKALRLYGYNSNSTSSEVVESMLNKLVEEDPKKFITLWVDNKTKDTHFLIEEAAAKNIIRKNKSTYKYGTDIIGYSLDDAIDYLDNPAHADLKMAIKAQMENKDLTFGEKKQDKEKVKSQFSKLKAEIETED